VLQAYGFDDAGQLYKRLTGPSDSFLSERPEGMAYVSGGQGLWSTVDDYLTFARMYHTHGRYCELINRLYCNTTTRPTNGGPILLSASQRVKARSMLDAGSKDSG
jgi:hypothetical protein